MRSLLILLVLLAGSAGAAEKIVITGDGKQGIDPAALSASGDAAITFKKVLVNDLKMSGWFSVEAGKGGMQLDGNCVSDASRMQADLRIAIASSQKILMSRKYSGTVQQMRQLAHQAADDIVMAIKAKKGIAQTRIVFVGSKSGRKNKADIYMCDYDGANMVQLTQKSSIFIKPRWTPDGKKLLFTAYFESNPFIYMINLGNNQLRRIIDFPGTNVGADMAPDGDRIAATLSKDGTVDIYVMSANGGNAKRLTATPKATESSPSWSPDGNNIVFVSDRSGKPSLYIKNVSTGNEKLLASVGSQNVAPDWGADGKIVWSSLREGNYQIVIYDPVANQEKQITRDGANYEDPSWAPDGRHIVCTRITGYHCEVYLLDTMGDAPVRLTTIQGEWYSPAWSP